MICPNLKSKKSQTGKETKNGKGLKLNQGMYF